MRRATDAPPPRWGGVAAGRAGDAPLASLSVKLCDVFPDGASALVTRGSLDLAFRDGVHAPAERAPLVPGQVYDVVVDLAGADLGGQLGVVRAPQRAQPRGVCVREAGFERDLSLEHPKRVRGDAGVERKPSLGAAADVSVDPLAHRLEQLARVTAGDPPVGAHLRQREEPRRVALEHELQVVARVEAENQALAGAVERVERERLVAHSMSIGLRRLSSDWAR